MSADWFCHAANTLFLASYSMSEQWKLRAVALTAQSVAMGYYVCLALWAPMVWNILFMTINVARLVKLARESRCKALQAAGSFEPGLDSGEAARTFPNHEIVVQDPSHPEIKHAWRSKRVVGFEHAGVQKARLRESLR